MNDIKWYVVQAYSGSENSVRNSIVERSDKAGFSELISDVIVPCKKVTQVKKGKKVTVERVFFPGYVLINAALSNELWHLIKNIPKVSGFVSQGDRPVPLHKHEVDNIFDKLKDNDFNLSEDIEYEIGESVRIVDGGSFDGFSGVVDSFISDKKKLVVLVSIFGRATPVNLAYNQVEKI
jgi:transcriptional antiterminator NusG